MNDSRDFQDAESVRSGHSLVTSQPVSFPPHPIPGGMLSRSIGMPSRREGPPNIWDTHGISGNVFAGPVVSSTAPYPQELNPWSSSTEEPLHSSTVEKSENQTPVQYQRCQSGPSAQNSVIPSEGDSSKNYGADQQRLLISRLLQGQFWRQKLEFREARQQSLTEMEELRKFQSSTFDTIARRKLIEDHNTILELSGRIQELQNEVNCMNDSKDFQDAESVRSGNSHVTSRPVSFPPHPIPEGMLRNSFITPSRRDGPPSILGHTWFFGTRFCKSRCVFISTLSSRIASMEFVNRRAALFVHSGEK